MVINLKNKFVFIILILFSVFAAPLCAVYGQVPSLSSSDSSSYDLSGSVLSQEIEAVCVNAVLVSGLKQTDTTQTLAYLNHPGFYNQVGCTFNSKISEVGLDFFRDLLKSVIQREITFKDNYYVFYHGQQRDFAFMQDLYSGLYKIISKKNIGDFIMLRLPSQDQYQFETVFDFLNYYIKNNEIFDEKKEFDLQPHIKKLLLSVNPSLFGNTFGPGCSTLEYFLCSTGCSFVDTSELIEKTFEFFGLKYIFYKHQMAIKELQTLLAECEKEKTGLLQQIFVPKIIIDQVAYRSWPLGRLYYEDRFPGNHPASIDLKNYELDKSSNDFDFDVTQFRLLMGGAMLDPRSGVKIFRYCNETAKFLEYKIKLKKLLDKISQDLFLNIFLNFRN